jgi:hypothetical protein
MQRMVYRRSVAPEVLFDSPEGARAITEDTATAFIAGQADFKLLGDSLGATRLAMFGHGIEATYGQKGIDTAQRELDKIADLEPDDPAAAVVEQIYGEARAKSVTKKQEAEQAAKELEPYHTAAAIVQRKIEKLGKPGITQRLFVAAVVVGMAIGGYAMDRDAKNKADATLRPDKSILPGNVLPIIPGFSDPAPVVSTISRDVTVVVDGKQVSIQKSASSNNQATNPLASNFKLTGAEADLDRPVAKELLDTVKKLHGTVDSVSVHGSASDEKYTSENGGIGIPDDDNGVLAGERADLGSDVIKQEAKALKLQLPEPAKTSSEAILGEDSEYSQDLVDPVEKITAYANAKNLDVNEVIAMFNKDPNTAKLEPEIKDLLKKGLYDARGVTYTVDFTTPSVIRTQKRYETQTLDAGKSISRDYPGETLPFAGAAMGLFLGWGYSNMGRYRYERRAHRRAVRMVKRGKA